jgi:hypothetical protein
MKYESVEYANEVRGFYDYDDDPADYDGPEYDEEEPDDLPEEPEVDEDPER